MSEALAIPRNSPAQHRRCGALEVLKYYSQFNPMQSPATREWRNPGGATYRTLFPLIARCA
jgi:hypothetical protein